MIHFLSIIIGWFTCGLFAVLLAAIGYYSNNRFAPGKMEIEYNKQVVSKLISWRNALIITFCMVFICGPIGLLLMLTKGTLFD